MTLVRTRSIPTRSRGLFNDFDRLFNDVNPQVFQRPAVSGAPVDLFETDEALVLQMAVPGLSGEDLDISVDGRNLSVRGTLPELAAEDGRRYWVQNLARGEFNRSLKLPTTVDADAIEARVAHGMLILTMPKMAEAKVRKIAIANN